MKKRLLSFLAVVLSAALMTGAIAVMSPIKAESANAALSAKTEPPHEVVMDGVSCDLLTVKGAVRAVSRIRTPKELKYIAFSYLEYGMTKLLNGIPDPNSRRALWK